jgi:hypothetical protein
MKSKRKKSENITFITMGLNSKEHRICLSGESKLH